MTAMYIPCYQEHKPRPRLQTPGEKVPRQTPKQLRMADLEDAFCSIVSTLLCMRDLNAPALESSKEARPHATGTTSSDRHDGLVT